jgi:glycosyltransferase involved in cell wall biosynthesis
MINTPLSLAKPILDEAYQRLGLPAGHGITPEEVESENEELRAYDYIFSSNAMVDAGLENLGLHPSSILRSSFGWSPARFSGNLSQKSQGKFRVLFVGSICVRKGVPQLLEAWRKSRVAGELLLVGGIEPVLEPLIAEYVSHGVRVLGYTPNIKEVYTSSDVFVFPTLEEGGPQVTYEAAACGIPIITTPMGRGRLIEDGVNGFVVDPYDVERLAELIATLAESPGLRHEISARAKTDAQRYSYEAIGRQRSTFLSRMNLSNKQAG